MAPKKSKGIKMELGAFLVDQATGSWADEMEGLPTAPMGEAGPAGGLGGSHLRRGNDDYGARGGSGGYGDRNDRNGGGDYGDRPQRAEVPLPTVAPFTAFVGNLSFEVMEQDVAAFFHGMTVTSVRMVSGIDGKPKGFCYVEFTTLDDLKSALEQSGADMNGRSVRISVAEPPRTREGRADEDMTWARQGPLPPLAGRSGGGFGGQQREGGFDRSRGNDSSFGGEGDGPRAGFGSKFVPSTDSPRRNNFESRGNNAGSPAGSNYERAPPSFEERGERAGFGSKFVPTPDRPSFGDRRPSGPQGDAPSSRADEESTWSRQGPLAPLPNMRPQRTFGDRTPPVDNPSSPTDSTSTPPLQRRRLELSARSTPLDSSSTTSSPLDSPSSKPNPFGAAKPIDGAERERQLEVKLAKEKEENAVKAAAEREKKLAEKLAAPKVEVTTTSTAAAAGSATTPTASRSDAAVWGHTPSGGSNGERKEYNNNNNSNKREYKNSDYRKQSGAAASSPTATTPTTASSTPVATAAKTIVKPALRKEGFSYSSMANTTEKEKKGPDAQLLQKLEETTI